MSERCQKAALMKNSALPAAEVGGTASGKGLPHPQKGGVTQRSLGAELRKNGSSQDPKIQGNDAEKHTHLQRFQ